MRNDMQNGITAHNIRHQCVERRAVHAALPAVALPLRAPMIVVEGGHEDTRAVTTPDGHSVDGTLEVLQRFKAEEDPLDKIEIVTRDGFWPKTDEFGDHRTHQSRAYAQRATGDYLWRSTSTSSTGPSIWRRSWPCCERSPR